MTPEQAIEITLQYRGCGSRRQEAAVVLVEEVRRMQTKFDKILNIKDIEPTSLWCLGWSECRATVREIIQGRAKK